MERTADQAQHDILAALRAVVRASRGCIYGVSADGTPWGHQIDSEDTRWLSCYHQFREVDPFHPRYFADRRASVFDTLEGRGPEGLAQAYIAGFRRPMGMAYKVEVFLRDRSDRIFAGIRLSREPALGEFAEPDLQALRLLQPVLSRAWSNALVEARIADLRMLLTRREAQVFDCLSAGLSNEAIGHELGIGLPTVKTHLVSIMAKTGARSRTELIAKLAASTCS